MQSTLGATLTLSIERIAATAVGASVGAVEANYFRANLVAYAVAIFLVGLLSFAFRLEKTAYRYASVTLTIIVLIPRSAAPWAIALHRFIEVSVGIIVALAVVRCGQNINRLHPFAPPNSAGGKTLCFLRFRLASGQPVVSPQFSNCRFLRGTLDCYFCQSPMRTRSRN